MSEPVPSPLLQRRLGPEIALWLGALFAVYGLLCCLTNMRDLYLKGNDCYQYLSMAENFRNGHGVSTCLLHYSHNLRTGTIPAPQTVFPPGYSLLIAGLECLGVRGEMAGVGVSFASFAATLALMVYLGRLLDIRREALAVILFMMLCNGFAWSFALRIYTESLFTAITLLSLALVIKADELDENSWPRLLTLAAGAAAAGLSYWVRYSGCFLIASLVFVYAGRWLWAPCRGRFRDAVLVTGLMAALVLPIWARNVHWTGTIQGGNALTIDKPLAGMGREFAFAWAQLLTGQVFSTAPAGLGFRLNRGLLALSIAGVVLLVAPRALAGARSIVRHGRARPIVLLTTYVLVYVLGLLYIGKYSKIDYHEPRMILPIFPVVLLGLACLFRSDGTSVMHPIVRPILWMLLAVIAVCYPVGHAGGLMHQSAGDHVRMAAWLAEAPRKSQDLRGDFCSMADWLEAHIPADAGVIAADGQEFGFVMKRTTITLPSWRESPSRHDAEIRALAAAYRVRYLLLFPDGIGTKELNEASPFIAQLLTGQCPDWLVEAQASEHCRVFRVVETALPE